MAPSAEPADGVAGASAWTPSSWRTKPIKQPAEYADPAAVDRATAELARLPPVVHPHEIARLRRSLRDVARGDAFLLQGGDCAELFDYCRADAVESKIKLLLQMSLVLIWGADKRIVRIARLAGQYAKPRSSPTEVLPDGREVPSFRGDILNGYHLEDRELDPQRLVKAYHHSAATLNYVRASIAAGIADLHRPLNWSLGHVQDPVLKAKYTEAVRFLQDMLRFMHTIGADRSPTLDTVDLFTSHEGLLLEYEESLTRLMERPPVPPDEKDYDEDDENGTGVGDNGAPRTEYYDTSAHFLWIGDRTRQVDGAHVEFFRGIANPVGVKVGPTTPVADLLELLRALNPRREVGKVTLITRYGASRVAELLPAHVRAVEGSEYRGRVIWQCDPMHGNTRTVVVEGEAAGVKTRRFGDILEELRQTLRVHRELGLSHLGGVHLELTGDAVTECLGGSEGLAEDDLSTNYTSFCDPRLNERQALELAFLIADSYRQERGDLAGQRQQ
ncbi:3-deoxy-7-phosphoheptulonate synthase [Durotheca rogersii]|uniref:3-deoxy-7-phosphoheptulonate synthase n=1 Tax=Durotheca rogersii TaxID=419775 RepID=UPI00222034F4|nr:3-deoxy-7-phosphoheptulonate synthase [Durotheca rogersii]KAI5865739.1 3-deoxy-7-phosphoheptulonate synthase [Durotheca rogersii]